MHSKLVCDNLAKKLLYILLDLIMKNISLNLISNDGFYL